MYKDKTVSVILPTYNEKDSIKKVIEDFYSIEEVDEVIVILPLITFTVDGKYNVFNLSCPSFGFGFSWSWIK